MISYYNTYASIAFNNEIVVNVDFIGLFHAYNQIKSSDKFVANNGAFENIVLGQNRIFLDGQINVSRI